MPTSKLRPVQGDLAGYAVIEAPKNQPAMTGFGTYDYTCSACSFVVLRGFDHSQYRIGKGVAFRCGQCAALNQMPDSGIPAGDPAKQLVIEVGKKPSK